MNANFKCKFPVRVCMGASCKAWDSEELLDNLTGESNSRERDLIVASTKCLNNCGGGVSVKSSLVNKIVKIRHPNNIKEETLNTVLGEKSFPQNIIFL